MTTDQTDFTQGSILKKLCWFMLPVLGALVLQAAYGAVDLLVVGRFGSTSGLSAVSTGSQVLNLVTFVVTQLAMGVTVLIARYLGEKRPEQIGSVIGGAAVIFTLLSAILLVGLVGFARPISVLMQAPAEAVDLTASYVRICGGGIFFIVAYNLFSAIFRGLGDSKSPLLFVLVACVVNIVGDLALVAGLGMDAAGAAIATVLAQAVSVVLAVVLLLKKHLPFTLRRTDFRLTPHCRKVLDVGLPLALQEGLTQVSFLALCAFVNRLGLEASSGYGVGLACGCLVFILVLLKGDVLAGCFSPDAAVVQKGFDYLKGFAPETIATAVLFSMIGYFNGTNHTLWVMVQGIVQTLLVRLPLAYVMSIQPNASLAKIGMAAPVSTAVGNGDDGFAPGQFRNGLLDQVLVFRVHAGGGLVQDDGASFKMARARAMRCCSPSER